MKAFLKLLFMTAIAGMIFTSCAKDDPQPEDPADDTVVEDPAPTPGPTPTGLQFSTLTPTENKANLEQAGIDLTNQIEGLTQATAMLAFENLGSLNPTKSAVNAGGIFKLINLAGLNPTGLKAEMADVTLQADIDAIAAEYSWNPLTMDWDSTGATNKVVFNFPYDNASTTNDCRLSIEISVVAVNSATTGLAEAPSNITMSLTVKGSVASSLSMVATYDADGLPSSITNTLEIDSYKWQLTLAQSISEVSSDFLFTNGSTTLMNYGFAIGGEFDADKIEDYANRVDAMVDYEQGIITEAGTYIADVEFYFQIMGIKLVQTANTKNLAASADDIAAKAETGNYTDEQLEDLAIDALNEDLDMYIMYTSDNTIFAEMEIYLVTNTDTYIDYIWNDAIMDYEQVEVTNEYREPMAQFIFGANESPVDADVYFQDGFDNFQTEFDAMITEFEDMTATW